MHGLEKELADSNRLRVTVEGLQQQLSMFQSRINEQAQSATQMQSKLHVLEQTLVVADIKKKEVDHLNTSLNTRTLRLEKKASDSSVPIGL